MSLKLIKAVVCVCAVIIQAFTLSGCSNNANEPYEAPSDSSSVESTGEFSSEDSAISSEQSTASSDASSSKPVPWDTNEKYPEVFLDHQILDFFEEDSLKVKVQLHCDHEAIRAKYEEKYPKLVENQYYWNRFQFNKYEQILRDFLLDYGLNYEELERLYRLSHICTYFDYELDKGTISLMLDDARVRSITYYPNGTALDHLIEF